MPRRRLHHMPHQGAHWHLAVRHGQAWLRPVPLIFCKVL
eukprot:CAMPEP_0195110428 /NCGR_PEP_ID=MMETSP0448-20130528/92664_1 /TAXON_ID=66468 /ORGANISM="Heterocapsa triquestra, Strain CCMP 448" /LENGTH=38 /DNA_ID= /DNA_START= /DNA_END= /DNA_ORIENTATION=